MKWVVYTVQALGMAAALWFALSLQSVHLQLAVATVGICFVGLLAMTTLLWQLRIPEPRLTRIPPHEVDDRVRAQAEGTLAAHVGTEPGWSLYGWVTGAVDKGLTLVAADGHRVAYVHHQNRTLSPVHLISVSGTRTLVSWAATTRQMVLLVPLDTDECAVVDRPPEALLRLHRAQAAGAAPDPMPDPIAALERVLIHHHRRTGHAAGCYLDGDGSGRFTWAGAVLGVWRFMPWEKRRRGRRETARSDALVRQATRPAVLPVRPRPAPQPVHRSTEPV